MSNIDPKAKKDRENGDERDFGRKEPNFREDKGYAPFAKDKRKRISRVEKAVPVKCNEDEYFNSEEYHRKKQEERRSFNPNFTRDNQRRDNRSDPGNDRRRQDERSGNGKTGGYKKSYGAKEGRNDFGKRNEWKGRPADTQNGMRGGRGKPKKDPHGRLPDGSYPQYPAPRFKEEVRLNRYLAASGLFSRREADEYIKKGQVTVNGEVVTEMGSKVKPGDVVKFEGRTVQSEKKVYIVMNKPRGYVTTLEDPHAEKTVMELLSNACTERVYPVGRLDKNSLGVLLITNDGDLTKRLTHPSYDKKKIYQVQLDKPLTRADMQQIVDGITLEDGEMHADEISYVGSSKRDIGIEIHSGRNRIVRRIFEHLGYHVQKLDRVYFAGLTKKNLKRGAWRFLSPREVETLKNGMYE